MVVVIPCPAYTFVSAGKVNKFVLISSSNINTLVLFINSINIFDYDYEKYFVNTILPVEYFNITRSSTNFL
mgnify:CR=1 FL=1